VEAGSRVAVLAVDPSSTVRGGSILGDKTRMNRLSTDARAFVRPSPTSGALGGVHRKTRETMLVCEAAGFDLVIIETVGVGQSETEVAGMVDTFLVLMLAGAGDELQGIKRGLLEVADLLAINKADGDNARNARRARAEYAAALKLMTPLHADWRPPVLTCSALTGDGVHGVWEAVEQHRATLEASGALAARRAAQQRAWMTRMVEQTLLADLWGHPAVQALRDELEDAVEAGRVTPTVAAERLLGAFRDG
ncbi:MAG: methylmalonyl Co-A mutase-associated GTPase MeaB, partial [Planctomycetota bacterium]